MAKLAKSGLLMWGALGSSLGATALAVGGWQYYESVNPTVHRLLTSNNYTWEPKTMDMNMELIVDAKVSETNNFKFSPQGCFRAMFPGVDVDPMISKGAVVAPSDPLASKGDFPTEQTYGTDPVGCAMVQMSNKGMERLAAKYEVTAKNDKWGWVLWTGIKYVKQSAGGGHGGSGSSVQYDAMSVVMFLKKDDGGSWSVWGGYFWNDPNVSSHFGNMHLLTPEGETVIDPKTSTEPSESSYAGVWETTQNGGKEIFQELELWNGQEGQRSDRAEILGRKPNGSTGQMFDEVGKSKICLFGYSCLGGVYTAENKWQKFEENSSQPNGGKLLNRWYGPFRNKLGGWTKLGNYCAGKSAVRNANAEELERVRTFCFAKVVSTGS